MKIGDRVKVSGDAFLHPRVWAQVIDRVGVIISADEGFDWAVSFGDDNAPGVVKAFHEDQLEVVA